MAYFGLILTQKYPKKIIVIEQPLGCQNSFFIFGGSNLTPQAPKGLKLWGYKRQVFSIVSMRSGILS